MYGLGCLDVHDILSQCIAMRNVASVRSVKKSALLTKLTVSMLVVLSDNLILHFQAFFLSSENKKMVPNYSMGTKRI